MWPFSKPKTDPVGEAAVIAEFHRRDLEYREACEELARFTGIKQFPFYGHSPASFYPENIEALTLAVAKLIKERDQ